jgi:hypothetical protein
MMRRTAKLGQFEQSEKSLLEAHQTISAVFGPNHQRTRDVAKALEIFTRHGQSRMKRRSGRSMMR